MARRAALALSTFVLALAAAPAAPAATVPPGFADERVALLEAPTATAFTPDGRLLVATQPGRLRLIENGELAPAPVVDVSARTCTESERGMLGVAVDPAFATNGYIYVYWVSRSTAGCPTGTATNPPFSRVSRFTMLGDVADPASERVLVDNIPSVGAAHHGGDMSFGKDGMLYVSTGDGGCDYLAPSNCQGLNDAARDRNILLGKVLRITRDGGVPPDNPYASTGDRCASTGRTTAGRNCQETFAMGLRNPFKMAFDPNAAGTRFLVNDVGGIAWEEVDEGRAAADYGWNVREGFCARGSTTNCGAPPAGMTNPTYAYGRDEGCKSITGGAFVPNGSGWPAAFGGAYLFADYVCGRIFRLNPLSGGGWTRTTFVDGLGAGSATSLRFGPPVGGAASLYYTTYADGGEVRRIVVVPTENRPPSARITATPTAGSVPLTVTFSGSGSSDPDAGDVISYLWDFGNGTTAETAVPSVKKTYWHDGTYTATLRVRDVAGAVSDPATIRIDVGNTPPVPRIDAPAATARFGVGDSVTLQGSASDAEDGTLSGDRLAWEVILHHGTDHTHPYRSGTGSQLTLPFPAPEDLLTTRTSYLEVRLTATDSAGRTATAVGELRPQLVDVTVASDPSGLTLGLQDTDVTAPYTLASWRGWRLRLSAPATQTVDGRTYTFAGWSDGGAATHEVVTPATATTYRARYDGEPAPGGVRGVYFDNSDFTAQKLTRIDPTIDFNWGTGSPASVIGPNTFSIRWTGRLLAGYSEQYRFYTTSDERVRVFLGGHRIINAWTAHTRREDVGWLTLQAGQAYDLVVEYAEGSGAALMRLEWESPSQPRQVIPASALQAP